MLCASRKRDSLYVVPALAEIFMGRFGLKPVLQTFAA